MRSAGAIESNKREMAVDTIRYRLFSAKTIPYVDVRVQVAVKALAAITKEYPKDVEGRIRDALTRFLPGTWSFSDIERCSESPGYETVMMKATTRVDIAGSYALADRARQASREGVELCDPEVFYDIAADQLSGIVDEMRVEVIARVRAHIEQMREATGRDWRIGDIEFGVEDRARSEHRSAKGAYRAEENMERLSRVYSDGDALAGKGFVGAERIELITGVTLKSDARSTCGA